MHKWGANMSDEIISSTGTNPAASGAQQPEAWTALASAGSLVLGQSSREYAVYNEQTVFGRWPLTPEGQRFAQETWEAHRQSLAHGLAYSATGYQDPERLGLPTDPALKSQSYASPMSYVGSTRRIVGWAQKTAQRSAAVAVLVWTSAIIFLLAVWVFLLGWYFVVFFLFGIFVIPYRLIRRSQRKNLHVQRTTLATQQAMLQQMAAAQQQSVVQQGYVQPPGVPLRQPPAVPPLPPPSAPLQ